MMLDALPVASLPAMRALGCSLDVPNLHDLTTETYLTLLAFVVAFLNNI